MKRFRIVRGGDSGGKTWGIGSNYSAATPKEAVAMELADHKKIDPTFGGLMAVSPGPKTRILSVYELVTVPESDWK